MGPPLASNRVTISVGSDAGTVIVAYGKPNEFVSVTVAREPNMPESVNVAVGCPMEFLSTMMDSVRVAVGTPCEFVNVTSVCTRDMPLHTEQSGIHTPFSKPPITVATAVVTTSTVGKGPVVDYGCWYSYGRQPLNLPRNDSCRRGHTYRLPPLAAFGS